MDKLPDIHDPAFRRARGLPDEAIQTVPINITDPAWAERLKATVILNEAPPNVLRSSQPTWVGLLLLFLSCLLLQ